MFYSFSFSTRSQKKNMLEKKYNLTLTSSSFNCSPWFSRPPFYQLHIHTITFAHKQRVNHNKFAWFRREFFSWCMRSHKIIFHVEDYELKEKILEILFFFASLFGLVGDNVLILFVAWMNFHWTWWTAWGFMCRKTQNNSNGYIYDLNISFYFIYFSTYPLLSPECMYEMNQ